MPVPYTFGTATAAIPLSQLDSNFATAITLGNTAVYLGNTTTSIGNLTLTNVTISSGEVTTGNASVSGNVTLTGGTANGVAYLNGSKVLTTGSALVFNGTNLGLGVTPSAWDTSNNVKALQLFSGSFWTYSLSSAFLSQNAYWNGTNRVYYASSSTKASEYSQNDGAHAWFTAPAGTAGNAITFTQAMTLDADGDLGIGTTSPTAKLHISVASAVVDGTKGVRITNPAGTVVMLECGNGGDSFVGTTSGSDFNIRTGNVTRATFDNSGNLLVGTTSNPNGRRFIAQTSLNTYAPFYFAQTATSGLVGNLYLTIGYAANNTSSSFISADDGTNARFVVYSNGGIANYSANNVNLSDRREKTNFAPAGDYLAKICAIPVQTYNYIDQNLEEDAGLTLGVVAQDVQAVAPELVTESDWSTEKDGSKIRLSIYQTDMQYALMKCIQEQQALITQLTARITALESA